MNKKTRDRADVLPRVMACAIWLVLGTSTFAAGHRVLPPGQLPADTRLGPLKGERGDFRFAPAKSPEEWKVRATRVRQIMRVAMGLWPMPTKTPLNATIHGIIDLGDYTIEKVYFESVPGFYVTGNLYRPKGKSGKRPAVLSPHGHFPGGRFQDEGRDAVREKIVQGAERFEDGGRSFMQSRCVQLARMGCIVFHYDMIGYGDSTQIPLDVAHRFSRSRVKFKQTPTEGFYSADALLHLHNPLGLHTFHSIRALDFVTSLPDVDSQRIAVTGGSGGGTQTFLLCAVDDRPLVSVPVVIVSTTRQGGCTCENICGFRIGTYNLEFTALHAPKPLLLISADDATRTMPQRGFPLLEQHYRALGAAGNVAHIALLQFPHNYNSVSRAAMYHWLNQHLNLGLKEPIVERSYRRLTKKQLTVWDEQHPQPKVGPDFEQQLLDWLTEDARQQLAKNLPRDRQTLKRFRNSIGTAWDILLRRLPNNAAPSFEMKASTIRESHQETLGLLRYRTVEGHQAELPIVKLTPSKAGRRCAIWLDRAGKAGLFNKDGSIKQPIRQLLTGGTTVVGVDLLNQGEFISDASDFQKRSRSLAGEKAFAGWTYCYNLPLFARRVHDVLAVGTWMQKESGVTLIGLGKAGPWAAAALAQSPGLFDRAAIDTHGFRFANLKDVYDVNFVPGAAKYGDLPSLLMLSSPTPLWLAGETENTLELIRAAYNANGKSGNLTTFSGESNDISRAAVRWLLK